MYLFPYCYRNRSRCVVRSGLPPVAAPAPTNAVTPPICVIHRHSLRATLIPSAQRSFASTSCSCHHRCTHTSITLLPLPQPLRCVASPPPRRSYHVPLSPPHSLTIPIAAPPTCLVLPTCTAPLLPPPTSNRLHYATPLLPPIPPPAQRRSCRPFLHQRSAASSYAPPHPPRNAG